ncbi:MAG: acyl carrier protein [Bacteroidota bacterium]
MPIDSKLIFLIAKHFNLKQKDVNLNTSKDLIEDWDSLEHIKLILEIEEEFKIKFPLDVVPNIISVRAIKNEIEKLKV